MNAHDEYEAALKHYEAERDTMRRLPKTADVETEVVPQLDAVKTAFNRLETARRAAFGREVAHSKPRARG